MRCLSCDKRLNNRESTRKYASSGTFVDLCDRCFSYVAEEIPDVADGVDADPDFDYEVDGESDLDALDGWADDAGLSTFESSGGGFDE